MSEKTNQTALSIRALWPLIIFAGLLIMFAIGLSRDPSELPSELIDRQFPSFELADLYDETRLHTDQDLTGQVSLVNVFGSWCVACVQEHPNLMTIGQSKSVRLIGLNWRDERPKAKRWLEKYGDPYGEIIFDPDSLLAIDLGVTGAPESFIVDKAGRIRYKHVGIITPQVWQDDLLPVILALDKS